MHRLLRFDRSHVRGVSDLMVFRRSISICLSVLALCCVCFAHADAQDFMTESEKLAFADVGNGKYITARKKAENLLAEDKNAVGANYIMGLVYWEGEGNLLRALTFLKKSIALFEDKYCGKSSGIPESSDDQMWHRRMLRDLAKLYNDLDDRQAEINAQTRLATLYGTSLGIDSVWALLKLGRFGEAEKIANQTILGNSQEDYWVDAAYNALTAIADARHEHGLSYRRSLDSLAYTAERSCVVLLNHARSLTLMLKFAEALEYLQKAVKAKNNDCVSNPYEEMSAVYLLDTQWQKAISAMLKSRKLPPERRLFEQTEPKTRAYIADIFYAMGFAQKSWDLEVTVIEAPQRLGFDSLLKEQLHLSQRIVFYAISADYLKRLDEHIDAWNAQSVFFRLAPLQSFPAFGLFKSENARTVEKLAEKRNIVRKKLWSVHQEIFKDALNPQNLLSLIVPTYVLPPQYNTAIVDAIGRKTALYLVDFQEKNLTPDELGAMKPIFDHFRAYIAFRGGDDVSALKYIEEYQKNVPAGLGLLDAQAKLMKAKIDLNRKNTQKAYEEMAEVFAAVPSLFRQFSVALPFRFADGIDSGNGDIALAMRIIRGGKRFAETPDAPFVVDISKNDGICRICLSSNLGTRYACSSVNLKDYDVPPNQPVPIPLIADNFYHAAFSPKVDLSQADLHSLDGSPIQISADQALEKLMKTSDGRFERFNDEE